MQLIAQAGTVDFDPAGTGPVVTKAGTAASTTEVVEEAVVEAVMVDLQGACPGHAINCTQDDFSY